MDRVVVRLARKHARGQPLLDPLCHLCFVRPLAQRLGEGYRAHGEKELLE